MAENWGNDFIAAYMAGVKQRMAREQQTFEQQQILDRAPLEKARIQAEIDSADAHAEAMHAQVGAAVEDYKSKVRHQFMTGERVAPSAIENPQMPGMISQQPMSAGDQLQQAGVNPQLMALLASKGAIQPQNIAPAAPDQTQQTNIQPTTFQPNIPAQTQEPSYIGTSAPSPTQFVKADPRLIPGGLAEIEGVPSPDETDTRLMKKQLLEAKMAGIKARMESEGKLPSEIAKEQAKEKADLEKQLKVEEKKAAAQKEIEGIKTTAASALEDKKAKAAMAVALTHENGRIQAANIAAAAHRYAADHKSSNVDEEAIKDAAMMSAMGEAPPPGYTNTGMAVKKVQSQSNLIPFDPKDAEKLKATTDVNVLYDTMLEHINKMPEGKLGALVDRISSKIPGTDASLFRDAVFGKAANISHTYGGEIGRLSDPDVARAMGTLAIPGITKQEAINRLNTMRLETASKVFDHILSGMKPHQQLMVLEGKGFDPAKFGIKGSDGNIHAKFSKSPTTGNWGVLDPKTLKYTSIN